MSGLLHAIADPGISPWWWKHCATFEANNRIVSETKLPNEYQKNRARSGTKVDTMLAAPHNKAPACDMCLAVCLSRYIGLLTVIHYSCSLETTLPKPFRQSPHRDSVNGIARCAIPSTYTIELVHTGAANASLESIVVERVWLVATTRHVSTPRTSVQ